MSRFMVSMLALALLLACTGSATRLRAKGRVDMQARPVAGKAVYPGAVWERRVPEALVITQIFARIQPANAGGSIKPGVKA